MVKTISEQLRDYFKMVPPSKERIAKVRKNWRKVRTPSVLVDVAVNDDTVTEVLTENAKNDNMNKSGEK